MSQSVSQHKTKTGKKRMPLAYQLEQLYEDQDPAFVLDSIAPLICWLDPEDKERSHRFELRENRIDGPFEHELAVSWNVDRLAQRDVRLVSDLRRFREHKSLCLEDQTKYAAYGLALVAISCLLGRRVVGVSCFRPPDLLLDTNRRALRGVEVAGRSSKGHAAFLQALDGVSGQPGKRGQLRGREDVVEAYISLWCRKPMVSLWERVKP